MTNEKTFLTHRHKNIIISLLLALAILSLWFNPVVNKLQPEALKSDAFSYAPGIFDPILFMQEYCSNQIYHRMYITKQWADNGISPWSPDSGFGQQTATPYLDDIRTMCQTMGFNHLYDVKRTGGVRGDSLCYQYGGIYCEQ